MLMPEAEPGFDSHGVVNKCRMRSSFLSLDFDDGEGYTSFRELGGSHRLLCSCAISKSDITTFLGHQTPEVIVIFS